MSALEAQRTRDRMQREPWNPANAEWVAARLRGSLVVAALEARRKKAWARQHPQALDTPSGATAWEATDSRGRTVFFSATSKPNAAGVFVSWVTRTQRNASGYTVKSDRSHHSLFTTERAARAMARRRWAAFSAKQRARRYAQQQRAAAPKAKRVRKARPKPDKRAQAEKQLKAWRTKAKRAATAIKKLERRLKRLTRTTGAA